MTTEVRVLDSWIEIRGGDPRGGCALHKSLSKLAGWRRERPGGEVTSKGEPCSVFRAPLYPHTAYPIIVKKMLGYMTIDARGADRLNVVAGSIELAKKALNEPPTLLLDPPRRDLFIHQLQALASARLMGYKCLIGDDMGLGKSTLALACFHQSKVDRLLVVCPASVKHNWVREIRATLGEDPMVHLIDGTRKKREKILYDILEMRDQGGVAIINYDLLKHLSEEDTHVLRSWASGNMVILDESHYIKSKDAKRTKWCREHLALAQFRLCLTGTPVRNMIDDLYSQIDFLRPGMWTSYSDFCRRYLVQVRITVGGRSFFQPKGTKNHAELNKLINTVQIRRLKKDVLDLPPKIRTTPILELDDPSRRIYKAMREMALLDLAQFDQNAPVFQPKAGSAVDAALRCEQIAQGFVGGIPDNYLKRILPLLTGHAERIPGRDKELIFPKSTKIKWVVETIDSLLLQGSPPAVVSKYNAPLYWLAEQYQDFGLINGDISSKKRDDIIQAFQAGELAGILLQVKISEGFNLTRGQDVIFLGRDWSPAVNAQAEERFYRIGTTGTVNILVPVVKGTIEEHINTRLGLKADEAEMALKNMTVGELRDIL